MANPYVGEIRIVGFSFAPKGWALCNGQILSISQNTALFAVLGTTYGGDGRTTFGLPNLQASAPLAAGNGNGLTPRTLGENGGEPNVTLLQTQIPGHNHGAGCLSGGGTSGSPSNAVWANEGTGRGIALYATSAGTPQALNAAAIKPNGGNQPHNNMPPFLGLCFIIAMQGLFPTRG
jgi:microcystin-dependent protein